MHRLVLSLAVAVGALVLVPAALPDGQPVPVIQGGTGVASPVPPGFHYVTVPDRTGGTILEMLDVANDAVSGWTRLRGSWGVPTVGTLGQGLSGDGRTLVLASLNGPYVSPSRFLVVDARRMSVVRRIALHGSFSFDALSPDGSRLYLIQYAHGRSGDLSHYLVREYDLRTNRLLPGRIADRSEHEKSMAGTPMTRTTSLGGRWVYTLYEKPSGEPFIHALDTVGGVAYCIDLPRRSGNGLYSAGLSLRDGGRTLAVASPSGHPWLDVAVGTWRISDPSSGFPWAWLGAGCGGALALGAAGALFLRRRRGEEVEQHPGHELGLA
jgi:hypothetical protein